GGVRIDGGAIVAGTDLAVNAARLVDGATASSVADGNRRHAGGALALSVDGDAHIAGTEWGAAGAWSGHFGSFAAGADTLLFSSGGTLVASADGDLALGVAALRADGDVTLSAGGTLSTDAAADQGVQSTTGDIRL